MFSIVNFTQRLSICQYFIVNLCFLCVFLSKLYFLFRIRKNYYSTNFFKTLFPLKKRYSPNNLAITISMCSRTAILLEWMTILLGNEELSSSKNRFVDTLITKPSLKGCLFVKWVERCTIHMSRKYFSKPDAMNRDNKTRLPTHP